MTPDELVKAMKDSLAEAHGCSPGECALIDDMTDEEMLKAVKNLFLRLGPPIGATREMLVRLTAEAQDAGSYGEPGTVAAVDNEPGSFDDPPPDNYPGEEALNKFTEDALAEGYGLHECPACASPNVVTNQGEGRCPDCAWELIK